MFFLQDVKPADATQDKRLAVYETVALRLLSVKRELTLLLATILVVTIALNVFGVSRSFAQSSNSKTSKIATPEEASGTSIRDFDALRALDRDYLNDPDGGETPVDKDDLWLPDMALAKKNTSDAHSGVRVITYDNGKTSTETRSAVPPASQPLSKNNPVTQRVAKAPTNQSDLQRASSSVATARYDAPQNATTNIRQTRGFADYSLDENSLSSSQGFANYQLGDTEPVYVAARENELEPTTDASRNVDFVASADDFPTVDPFLGDFSAVDPSNAPSAVTLWQSTADAIESNASNGSSTSANFGLDPLLANTETTAPTSVDAPISNAVLDEFSKEDALSFPEVDVPVVNEPLPMPSNAPATSAESSAFANTPNTTSESYKPIDYLAEPETDHAVANGDDEPFRESYRVSDLERTEQQPVKNDVAKQGQSLESAPLSEAQLKNLTIEDVRISGLEMTAQQFNKIVKTRIGAKFHQQRLEEDKRALLQTKQFIDVAVSTSWSSDKPDKVVVNFDLTPRRMMRYIKVVGNRKISKHDILEELALKPGESRMDPYEVENGRLRIIEFYKSKDYGEPHVEILRGDRPEDVGVVYLINEGLKQRVLRAKFVGNSIVSSARLHSLISVKPGFLYFIGGAFTRERLDADVEKLLEYYRNLGYFDARVDREYEESRWFGGLGKDNAWVSVRYIIDEGPRYKIRDFVFNGNRVVTSEDLAKTLKVKKGSFYRFDEIEADRIALRYKYQDLGYVRADITPNQVFTDEVGFVDIRYDVNEDHRYRVRDVVVDYVGTESRTMTPVVLNMLDISPGELLNGKKIRMSENTLRQSGYFNDKPTEGQLPEIAVVPDESKSYKLNRAGRAELVSDSSKDEKQKESEGSRRNSDTTRGQSAKEPALRDEIQSRNRVTRGQVPVEKNARSELYVPYEETKKITSSQTRSSSTDIVAKSSFLSYEPSASSIERRSMDVKPVVPQRVSQTSALVRGQTRQVPSGFSDVTTQSSNAPASGYRSYDSSNSSALGSQFTDGLDYANGASANLLNSAVTQSYDSYHSDSSNALLSTEDESTPGFSDGVYGSIGKEILEPVTPETDEIYDGTVLVKVQEGRTGMFQASIGVNSDYGLVGNVSFTERNFNLFRMPTRLFSCDGWQDAFRGGGQIFSVQASPGTNIQSYRMSWDVPYVFNTKYLFGVTGLYGEHSFDEWFEARYGGELRVGRQWTPRFSTTLNGGIYNVKLKDPAVGFVPDLNEALGTNRMYTVGLTATYDTRNHPYSPSAGFLLKGSGEVGFGDYNFPRVTLDGRYYKTLHKRVDGTGRWVVGFSSHMGWTGDDTPIFERYYGGGSQNLRGFEYREVTPRYLKTGFGVGGNFEFYNSAELFIPVSGGDEFQLAFFIDTGTVAESMKKWGRYRVAPGVGLRFSIPMLGPAPLALDFAFPISKSSEDVTEVFTFNLSGSR